MRKCQIKKRVAIESPYIVSLLLVGSFVLVLATPGRLTVGQISAFTIHCLVCIYCIVRLWRLFRLAVFYSSEFDEYYEYAKAQERLLKNLNAVYKHDKI